MMENKFILLLGVIFLFGIISSQTISIDLDLNDNYYSGDSLQRNLTINTPNNMWVYLSHNVSDGINVSYENPIWVEKEKTILINLSFNKYLESGQYNLIFYGSGESDEIISPSSSGGSGGSSGGSCNFYLNKNLYKKSYLLNLRKTCDINFELLNKHSLEFSDYNSGSIILNDKKYNEEYTLTEDKILCLQGEKDGLKIIIKSKSNYRITIDTSLEKDYCLASNGGGIVGGGGIIDEEPIEELKDTEHTFNWLYVIVPSLSLIFLLLVVWLIILNKKLKNKT